MADNFFLDLVTPERTLFSGTVRELVAPGLLGEFGVLAGHAHMLAELTAGRLIYREQTGDRLMAAAGGFAEVSGEKVTVLLDDAVYAEDLDAAFLKEEIEQLEARNLQPEDEGYDEWQEELRWKRACFEVSQKK